MNGVFDWVRHYGYGALFLLLLLGIVGVPVPDETLLIYCGYLIWKGVFHKTFAFLAAMTGSWCGITLSYTIGRTLGAGAVHRYGKYLHVTEARLARVHQWFDRIGHWALMGGYFIVGVRHFTAIVAGMSGLGFASFAAYAWTGAALWVATFLSLGFFLGDKWEEIGELLHRDILYASLILIVAALAIWLIRRKKEPSALKG
jgi:membrane protein DedA with SNARE-associated domain